MDPKIKTVKFPYRVLLQERYTMHGITVKFDVKTMLHCRFIVCQISPRGFVYGNPQVSVPNSVECAVYGEDEI